MYPQPRKGVESFDIDFASSFNHIRGWCDFAFINHAFHTWLLTFNRVAIFNQKPNPQDFTCTKTGITLG
jgi:hypothetical protein